MSFRIEPQAQDYFDTLPFESAAEQEARVRLERAIDRHTRRHTSMSASRRRRERAAHQAWEWEQERRGEEAAALAATMHFDFPLTGRFEEEERVYGYDGHDFQEGWR